MFLFYFDETGDSSLKESAIRKDPWFVLGAAGLDSQCWRAIDDRLTDIKRSFFPGISSEKIEIKSTSIRSTGGPYPRWPFSLLSLEQVNELVESVYSIFDEFPVTLFFVAIQKEEHRNRYAGKVQRPRSPYELAFEFLIERIDYFLMEKDNDIGFFILDEKHEFEKMIRERQLHYQRYGTWEKRTIDNVKEAPFFTSSRFSQLVTLPDLHAYNVYHRFRYDKPDYPFFERTKKYLYKRAGRIEGYGLKRFP